MKNVERELDREVQTLPNFKTKTHLEITGSFKNCQMLILWFHQVPDADI